MARKVQVILSDDLDENLPADETVSFSLDGTSQYLNPVSWFTALRGGRAEARNVIRAMASARGMRRLTASARPPR